MKIRSIIAALAVCSASFAFAADLPNVKILATGGTIAGTASSGRTERRAAFSAKRTATI